MTTLDRPRLLSPFWWLLIMAAIMAGVSCLQKWKEQDQLKAEPRHLLKPDQGFLYRYSLCGKRIFEGENGQLVMPVCKQCRKGEKND